jgi:hypothetical protein
VLPDGPTSGPLFTATPPKTSGDRRKKQSNRALYGVDSQHQLRLLLRPGQVLTVNGAPREIGSLRALEAARGSFGAARGFSDDGRVTALVTFTDRSEALVHISLP